MTKQKVSATKKNTGEPITVDLFMEGIRAKLASDSRRVPIGPIVSYIRKNLPGKDFEAFIDQLLEIGKDQPWFTQLSLDFLSRIGERPKESDRAFVRRAVIICRRKCNFPLDETRPVLSSSISDQEETAIAEWITDSRNHFADVIWCRAAIVSLLTIEEKFPSGKCLLALQSFLKAVVPSKSARALKRPMNANIIPHRESQEYLKRIASIFMSDRQSISKLSLFQDISNPILRLLGRCEVTLSRTSSELALKQEDLQASIQRISSLESDIQDLTQKTKRLEQDLTNLEAALAAEQENLRKMREWWEEKVQAEKNAHLSTFKRALRHEVLEAVISLDDSKPNVSMALDRLKRIQKMMIESGEQQT